MKKFLPLVLIAAFFAACDKVDGPYSEKPDGFNTDTGAVRKVLVEDYTGQKCGNCPRAAEAVEGIKDIYGDRVVSIGIHVGFFATPNTSGTKFLYDFRTPVGDELDQTFGNGDAGLPNGLVNRKTVNGVLIQGYNNWATVVAQTLTAAPDARIKIANTYNAATRQVSTNIKTSVLNNLSGNYKLCVYVTEDNVVNWQKDYSLSEQDIPNYTHRHVLRGSMNTTWGTAVGTGALAQGDVYEGIFNMTLGNDWNAEQCAVVAFLYNVATKEVIQVEELKIIE